MNYRVLQIGVAVSYLVGCIGLGIGTGRIGVMLLGNDAKFLGYLLLMLVLLPVPSVALAIGHAELQTKIKENFGPKEVDQSGA